MTASLSLGWAINTHICSVKPYPQAKVCSSRNTHTLPTALYFYLYYMLTLHPLPPFPSATLYWQQKKSSSLSSSLLSLYPSPPAEQVTHVVISDIDVFLLLLEDVGWGQLLCKRSVSCRQSIQLCLFCYNVCHSPQRHNWFSTILFTKAKPSGMFRSNFKKETHLAFLSLFMLCVYSPTSTSFEQFQK